MVMMRVFRLTRQLFLIAAGCFFLLFGVHLLVSAYQLNNPFWFIMTFFASNLIILISAALVIGFVIRMVRPQKPEEESAQNEARKEG